MRSLLSIVLCLALVATAVGADRLDPWESRLIRIGVYEFDTRQGEPQLPARLTTSGGEMWLVQLEAPIREEAKDLLRAAGVEFYDYIPNNAFLCRVPVGREALVVSSRAAVWMGRYHPAYRLPADLLAVPGPIEVKVLGFPWESGPELVETLRQMGMEVTDWGVDPLNVRVRGQIDAARLPDVVSLEAVYYVEKWIRARLHNPQAQWVMQTNGNANRRLWDLGLEGQNQVVSTSDTGIFMEHNMFRDAAVPVTTWGDYPNHRKVIAYVQGRAGADFGDEAASWWHGTHTGGSACGDDSYCGGTQPYDGMALLAKNYFIDLGASTGGFGGPQSLWTMFNYGYNGNAGGRAYVHSMSWGSNSNGAYAADDRAVDHWIWWHQDGSVFTSAGNDDPPPGGNDEYVGSPGNSKSVVTVASCSNGYGANMYSTWCSRGPTDDGRIKPDILAPGDFIWSSVGPNIGSYDWSSGTSMSCPIAAGSALQVRQYFEDGWYPTGSPAAPDAVHPSSALIKAVMVNGGDENMSSYTVPSFYIGWGRTCLDSVLYFPGDARGLQVVDDTLGVQTGQTDSYQYEIQTCGKLEVTLAWSDYPAAIYANPTIINDLDLEVQVPGGSVYKGNVYSGGWSVTGGSYDRLNTVECVHLANPTAGTYTIRVIGHDVPMATSQPYALVLTGNFGGDTQPPNAIDDLSIQLSGADMVLTWTDPGDDVGVVEYRVYRSTTAHFQPTGIPCATVPAPTTTWTDVGIAGTPSINFFYNVRARDAVGSEGPPSNYVGEFDFDTSD